MMFIDFWKENNFFFYQTGTDPGNDKTLVLSAERGIGEGVQMPENPIGGNAHYIIDAKVANELFTTRSKSLDDLKKDENKNTCTTKLLYPIGVRQIKDLARNSK